MVCFGRYIEKRFINLGCALWDRQAYLVYDKAQDVPFVQDLTGFGRYTWGVLRVWLARRRLAIGDELEPTDLPELLDI